MEVSCRMKDRSTKLFCPGLELPGARLFYFLLKGQAGLYSSRGSSLIHYRPRPSYLQKSGEKAFSLLWLVGGNKRPLDWNSLVVSSRLASFSLSLSIGRARHYTPDKNRTPGLELDSWFGCCILPVDFSSTYHHCTGSRARLSRIWSKMPRVTLR